MSTISTDPVGEARTALAKWQAEGGQPWDLPSEAAHFALACHGCEANKAGTFEALMAVSDECDECSGDGSHCDDSHPGNHAHPCDRCGGHGRVPKGTPQ